MKNMTPAAMAAAVQGTLTGADPFPDREITGVTTDSRKITEGCLFAAIRGEHSDGHAYIPQAVSSGAAVILGEELPEDLPVPGIRVENTAKALQPLAAYYLDQLSLPRVGIIGSAGKTSTKEMTAAVLSQKFRVLKTEGNFNNELGVPLTVFRITEDDEIAVIEMGINHFGEMDRLAKIVRPDTAVMTNIGTAHLEFLHTREGILQAKSEVFRHMDGNGRVILNGDDDMLSTVTDVNGAAPIRFSTQDPSADVFAEDIVSRGLAGEEFTLCMDGLRERVTVPSPGIHSVYNALAGAACGRRYGLTIREIAAGISSYRGLPGRQRVLRTPYLTIIDDVYNANPSSMKASLKILEETPGRRVAILGDMGELGEETKELHREVGRSAAGLRIDLVCCVGELGREIGEGILEERGEGSRKIDEDILDECGEGSRENGEDIPEKRRESGKPEAAFFADKQELTEKLPVLLQEGDTVLLKASHFMGFEELIPVLEKIS